MPTSILGSIGVGYDKWRKDESARLAANEVNKDIANLELFKPSNTELVAENKRLRAMLAEDSPHTKVSHTKHVGMTHEPHEKQLA